MEIYTLEIENELGRPEITTDNPGNYFTQILGPRGWTRSTKIPHRGTSIGS